MAVPYSELAHLFLSIRTQIKLYHWQTRSYARHKATDRFLETFEPLVDRFVEASQGIAVADILSPNESRRGDRIATRQELSRHQTSIVEKYASEDWTDRSALKRLEAFRSFLANLHLPQSELAQIRDDMLENADITLYLFTLE